MVNMAANKALKNEVLGFLGTIGIPLLYLLILLLIGNNVDAVPRWVPIPVTLWLSHPYVRGFWLVMAVIGLILWLWSYWSLRRAFGVLPGKKKRVTSGPYGIIKHPMYVAIFLTFNGLALAALSWPGFVVNLIVLTPVNVVRGRKEEEELED